MSQKTVLQPNDGSLYLFLVRDGVSDHLLSWDESSQEPKRRDFTNPINKTRKISYHASGLVLYHNTNLQKTFCEPLCAISSVNKFVFYVIPRLEKLSPISCVDEKDFVFELNQSEPIQFSFNVAPWQHVSQNVHFAIRFRDLFALIVEVAPPTIEIPPGLADYVTIAAIKNPEIDSPIISEPEAFILFHKKLNATQTAVVYSPNSKGEYRIICAVPMRIPPRLEVKFVDDTYVAEQLPPHPKRGNSEVRFRVRGKGGYVKHEVQIASFVLDAEL